MAAEPALGPGALAGYGCDVAQGGAVANATLTDAFRRYVHVGMRAMAHGAGGVVGRELLPWAGAWWGE